MTRYRFTNTSGTQNGYVDAPNIAKAREKVHARMRRKGVKGMFYLSSKTGKATTRFSISTSRDSTTTYSKSGWYDKTKATRYKRTKSGWKKKR